jgi:glycosyltransferase involved in cell wall biosynthesis
MTISFCLITRDEEADLPRCLGSLAGLADEVVVVDSGSRDRTEEIARGFGARFVSRGWPGYVAQKNHALSLAGSEWIFSIDADEELSPELRGELVELRRSGPAAGVVGYSAPRCVLYEGRWIRHGDWYPDRLTRLFRNGSARFEGGKVHERLVVDGAVVPLRGDLCHYSFRDSADHVARARHYARLWAETQLERGREAGPLAPVSRAAFRWFRYYVLRLGFLDGPQGWKIARTVSKEAYWKYSLLRELRRTSR